MKLVFSERAWREYLYWQETDRAVLSRINDLIRDASRSPFKGIGKPEPLVGPLKGLWPRRITREHRFVYRISGRDSEQSLEIVTCRFHYD